MPMAAMDGGGTALGALVGRRSRVPAYVAGTLCWVTNGSVGVRAPGRANGWPTTKDGWTREEGWDRDGIVMGS